ncbi:MAG: DUF3179 domain-containing protein [Gammaproteobacteria bacterium]|nr:DUF3179 domain-containing protein [Gammaproteobacteria bacterium]
MTINMPNWARATLRIGILVTMGALLLKALGLAPFTNAFSSSEWPKTDFDKRTVDLSEIRSGGPPKDGIPAIDEPKFISVEQAATQFGPREPVIVATYNGDARAYPLQILIWHEIVNDEVGGVPISVTFCPLCNASIIFDRRHRGQVLDFGTTGRLRKSDLVMYDRQTETWWQQFNGEGIVGEYAGDTLTQLPTRIVAFEDFGSNHPDGKVLSTETGYYRDYGRNPYSGYDSINNSPFLLSDPVDPRLPPMERVLAVSNAGGHRLYPFTVLRSEPVINDTFGGLHVAVFSKNNTASVLDTSRTVEGRQIPAANAFARRVDGKVLEFTVRDGRIVDTATGSAWNILGESTAGPMRGKRLEPLTGGVHFAFAWLVFRPDSEIYGAAAQ